MRRKSNSNILTYRFSTALRERSPGREDVEPSYTRQLSWVNSFIHYHFFLMGDTLPKPLKLSYGTNIIGNDSVV